MSERHATRLGNIGNYHSLLPLAVPANDGRDIRTTHGFITRGRRGRLLKDKFEVLNSCHRWV